MSHLLWYLHKVILRKIQLRDTSYVMRRLYCIPLHSQNTKTTVEVSSEAKSVKRFSPAFISLFTNNIGLHKKGIPRSPFPVCVARNPLKRRQLNYFRYTKADRHRESHKRTTKTTLLCTIYQGAFVGNGVNTDSSRLAIHCGHYNIQLLVFKTFTFQKRISLCFKYFYHIKQVPFHLMKRQKLRQSP